jgi:hypothetical protein
MAYPTAVNSRVTGSITAINLEVLGLAPAMAVGLLYQATSQALANAAANASAAQAQINQLAETVTKDGIKLINKAVA